MNSIHIIFWSTDFCIKWNFFDMILDFLVRFKYQMVVSTRSWIILVKMFKMNIKWSQSWTKMKNVSEQKTTNNNQYCRPISPDMECLIFDSVQSYIYILIVNMIWNMKCVEKPASDICSHQSVRFYGIFRFSSCIFVCMNEMQKPAFDVHWIRTFR